MGIYFILICLISPPDSNQNVLETNFYMNKIQKKAQIAIKLTKTFGDICFYYYLGSWLFDRTMNKANNKEKVCGRKSCRLTKEQNWPDYLKLFKI